MRRACSILASASRCAAPRPTCDVIRDFSFFRIDVSQRGDANQKLRRTWPSAAHSCHVPDGSTATMWGHGPSRAIH